MSFSAAHEFKAFRKNCQSCQERKARFRYRGVIRADREHTLCFECYRSARDRRRAQMLADRGSTLSDLPSSVLARGESRGASRPAAVSRAAPETAHPKPETTPIGKIAHRRAMLAHLQQLQRVAIGV
jgi:hypothetical protein